MFKKFLITLITLVSIFSFYSVNAEVVVWESRFWEEWDDPIIFGREYLPDETTWNDSSFIQNRWVWNSEIKNSLLNISKNNVINNSSDNWLTSMQSILIWIKNTLTGFLLIIAVGVFLYIWIRIVLARWNPEEFKKAWMHLIYAVIWIFIVSMAWAAVTLVSGLSI